MKLKLLTGAALAALLAAPVAFAQDAGSADNTWAEHGWYGAIDLGAHFLRHMGEVGSDELPAGNGINIRNEGWTYAGFARLGYRFTPNFRLELEGGYRNGARVIHDADLTSPNNGLSVCGTATTEPGLSNCQAPAGRTRSITVMANGIIDILPSSRFDPFIGGGVGLNTVTQHSYGMIEYFDVPGPYTLNIEGTATKFAYQGIGGVAFRANARTNRRHLPLSERQQGQFPQHNRLSGGEPGRTDGGNLHRHL